MIINEIRTKPTEICEFTDFFKKSLDKNHKLIQQSKVQVFSRGEVLNRLIVSRKQKKTLLSRTKVKV